LMVLLGAGDGCREVVDMAQSEIEARETSDDGEQRRRPPSREGLWAEVMRARVDVALERQDPRHHVGPSSRLALIDALEAYLESIEELRYPLPFALVNELRMQRVACHRHPAA